MKKSEIFIVPYFNARQRTPIQIKSAYQKSNCLFVVWSLSMLNVPCVFSKFQVNFSYVPKCDSKRMIFIIVLNTHLKHVTLNKIYLMLVFTKISKYFPHVSFKFSIIILIFLFVINFILFYNLRSIGYVQNTVPILVRKVKK